MIMQELFNDDFMIITESYLLIAFVNQINTFAVYRCVHHIFVISI